MRLPSNKHRTWHKEASLQLIGIKPHHEITNVMIQFYAPDRRKTDLTNKAESIMDLLVDCGVIADDNWFEIPSISLSCDGVDPKNPRAEITIYGKEKV